MIYVVKDEVVYAVRKALVGVVIYGKDGMLTAMLQILTTICSVWECMQK
jgi:hypothetical protein